MTLDEAIKHAEEVAEEQEKAAKEWHENQVRKCELIPFAEMDYTHENECKECAAEHRQLAEWLKDYKWLLEQEQKIVPIAEIKFDDDMLHEIAEEAVKNIEIEPKTGHWAYTDRTNIYGGREIVCSECGESFMVSPQTQEHLYEYERFCCRCGAKMEA